MNEPVYSVLFFLVMVIVLVLTACGPGFVHFDFTVCSPATEMQTATTTQTNNGTTPVTRTINATQAAPPCPLQAFTP